MNKHRNKRQQIWTLDQLLDGVEHYLYTAEGYVQHVLSNERPNEEMNAEAWIRMVATQLGFIYKLMLDRSTSAPDMTGTRYLEMQKRLHKAEDDFKKRGKYDPV